ncbi:YncE family protein [Actinoplanes sp. NPDC049265]|uniref:YncE family protein n=1 Tax=Actinoplanes sp. NPDC049265 TaxID=3363902 RepID=UPI00370FEC18
MTTALGVAATEGPAAADTDLGLPGYGDLIANDEHDRVFVSGGPSSNGITVTDLDGEVVKHIKNQYGATGLAQDADTEWVYAALAAGDAITEIDVHTLKESDHIQLPANTCPTHLAMADDVLWFGHGCGDNWSGGIGRVTWPEPTEENPDPEPVVDLNVQGDLRFQRAPLLAVRDDGDPDERGTLVAAQLNLSFSTVSVYDIGEDRGLTSRASSSAPGSNLFDIGLDQYGETLLTGAGGRNATQAYATADLSGRGSYYTGYHPLAVAASPDDCYVVSGVRATGDDIYLYETGGVVPEKRIDITDDVLAPRGLTFSDDMEHLYAVTVPAAGGAPELHVIHDWRP